MTDMTRDQVEALLKGIKDRYLEQDIVSLHQVKDISVEGGKVAVSVVQGYPAGNYRDELAAEIKAALAAAGATDADVSVTTQVAAHAVQKSVKRKTLTRAQYFADHVIYL